MTFFHGPNKHAEYVILILLILMLYEVGVLKSSFRIVMYSLLHFIHYWRRLSRKQKLTIWFVVSMVLGVNACNRLILKFIKRKRRSRCSRRMRRAMCMNRSRAASKQRRMFINQSDLHDLLKGIRVGEASSPGPPFLSARINITGGHGKREPPPAALWQLTMITVNCSLDRSKSMSLVGLQLSSASRSST